MVPAGEGGSLPRPQNLSARGCGSPRICEIFCKKYAVYLTLGVLCVCLPVYVFFSMVASLTILGSFVSGVCIMHGLYGSRFQNYIKCSNNWAPSLGVTPSASAFSVCWTDTCPRFEKSGLIQPWENLMVPAEVDEALEEFLNMTFEKYICAWHRDITSDSSFLYELKSGVRNAIAVLLRRAQRIDLAKLITRKLVRVALSHLDCCLQVSRRKGGDKNGLEESVFEYYGPDLHLAVYSRSCELSYLHGLSEKVLPFLLPLEQLQCRSVICLVKEILSSTILLSAMDALADPDIVNSLLLIFFDKTPMVRYPASMKPNVVLLDNFVRSTPPQSPSSLGEAVPVNPNEAKYLSSLMDFMRNGGKIGILHFYLAIDDFKDRLLNPDLTHDDILILHAELKVLYGVYMAPNAVERLNFDKDVVAVFKIISDGLPEGIIKLQSTEPLYKAHEFSFSLLEKCIYQFYKSEEYFEYICGAKNKLLMRSSSRQSKKLSTAAKIGNKINKIRGALRPVTIDGQIEEDHSDLADAGFEADEMKLAMDIDSGYSRDLSAWRVSIPNVECRKDEQGKLYYAFVIDVQRIDVSNKDNPDEFHWVVERQHHEFYVLEAKLTEFHGDIVDIHLPSKRSFGNKGLEYMEGRRAALEEFLQRLLQKPTFRGSELLFTFLSSTGDFTKGILPDINLGRIIKNVPMKLLKEKGQHLETFLQNFIASTESSKQKSCKTEYKDVYSQPSSTVVRKLRKSVYGDNAGRRMDCSPSAPLRFKSVLPQEGLSDYILYLGLKVLQMPRNLFQVLVAVLRGFGMLFESFVESYFAVQLRKALVPQRIAFLVHLLRDVVFLKESKLRTAVEKQRRAEEALKKAKAFLPRNLVRLFGTNGYENGMTKLFEILQCPRLNKQLGYALFDVVVLELFPELGAASDIDEGSSGDWVDNTRMTSQREAVQ